MCPFHRCLRRSRQLSGPRGTSFLADGIDLVDEDDGGGVLLGLLEEVAHPLGPHPHVHLDELAPAYREEGHVALPRAGLGDHGLAGPGGAREEGSLGNPGPQLVVLLGVLEEVDELDDFLLGLLHADHLAEGDLDGLLEAVTAVVLEHVEPPSLALAPVAPPQLRHRLDEEVEQHQRQHRPGVRYEVGAGRDHFLPDNDLPPFLGAEFCLEVKLAVVGKNSVEPQFLEGLVGEAVADGPVPLKDVHVAVDVLPLCAFVVV